MTFKIYIPTWKVMATFSNSGEDVIKRVIEAVPVSAKTEEEIREYYELDRCLEFIRKHNKVLYKSSIFKYHVTIM